MATKKTAVAAPEHPTWQSVIDALRAGEHTEEVRYMENLRRAAKDPKVSTPALAKMIGKLFPSLQKDRKK